MSIRGYTRKKTASVTINNDSKIQQNNIDLAIEDTIRPGDLK